MDTSTQVYKAESIFRWRRWTRWRMALAVPAVILASIAGWALFVFADMGLCGVGLDGPAGTSSLITTNSERWPVAGRAVLAILVLAAPWVQLSILRIHRLVEVLLFLVVGVGVCYLPSLFLLRVLSAPIESLNMVCHEFPF